MASDSTDGNRVMEACQPGGTPWHTTRPMADDRVLAEPVLIGRRRSPPAVDREPGLRRVARTIVVVDVVEFGRLTETDEDGAVARWLGLVALIKAGILPGHGGQLFKELGDGLLIAFTEVGRAVAATLAMQQLGRQRNAGLLHDAQMHLRIGVEHAEVIVGYDDLYGCGVNLAARLASLAGPGEIVVSASVRDRLIPSIDAEVEDLGFCYVKHRKAPVRAFRLDAPGSRPSPLMRLPPGLAPADLHPAIAVLPFRCRDQDPAHQVIGEVVADEVIHALSRSTDLNVISRLSTSQFRGRDVDLATVRAHLHADYVLSGHYRVDADRLRLDAELAEAGSARILWAQQFTERVDRLLHDDRQIINQLVVKLALAVTAHEVERAKSRPLPTLESYTLLLAAISLMHRLSLPDFERARTLLETLIQRAPRQCIPQAWLAKWHVLRVQQGWSDDPRKDAAQALELTRRALDTDPECTLSLTVDGFVHANLLKQLDQARTRYDLALRFNPNDALAWLLRGTLDAFKGDGREAVGQTSRALKLSPLDPHRYFFDSLAATAQLAAHRYERALALAERSLMANRTHTSTLRARAIAEWHLGRHGEARCTVRELLRLEPELTIRRYLERSPAADFPTGKEWASALRGAGVPA